jgi:hypothetical protein
MTHQSKDRMHIGMQTSPWIIRGSTAIILTVVVVLTLHNQSKYYEMSSKSAGLPHVLFESLSLLKYCIIKPFSLLISSPVGSVLGPYLYGT